MADNSSPTKRQRAPTITIETTPSAQTQTQETDITSPSSDNPNALSVPTHRSRGDSVNSQASQSSVGTAGSHTLAESTHGSIGQPSPTSPPLEDDTFKPESEDEAKTFQIENNPFGTTPGHLGKFAPRKNLNALALLHGPAGLEILLRTNLKNGLDVDEQHLDGQVSSKDVDNIALGSSSDPEKLQPVPSSKPESDEPSTDAFIDRKRVFGENRLPPVKRKTLLQLAWMAWQDKILILLTAAAVVSLAIGIYTSITKEEASGAKVDWVEGVAILVAVFIVVMVGAIVDWSKERQFANLNRQKEDRYIKVLRSGKTRLISVYEVYPGDIIHLEPGDMIPVDGIYIKGSGVACDESAATGESDLIKKTPANEVMKAYAEGRATPKMDPFIIAGSQCNEGIGTFLCTAVGVHSSHGKTLQSLQESTPPTPLQERLDKLAGGIARFGGASASVLFVILIIKFGVFFHHPFTNANGERLSKTGPQHVQEFFAVLILCITIVVVAVPEGLPLAVTLSLAFATKRMTKDNNLVRHLKSCETMGNATVICSDKTGTLTQNLMTVVAGAMGRGSIKFNDSKELKESESDEKLSSKLEVPIYRLHEEVPNDLKKLLKELIAANSTAFEGEQNGRPVFIGSKTETALLEFSQRCFGMGNLKTERNQANIVQLFPFDSGKKCMGVVTHSNNVHRLYIKGASEIVLSKCSHSFKDPSQSLEASALSDDDRKHLRNIISEYASRSLRTIGLAYKDFEQWPPQGARTQPDNAEHVEFDDVFSGLTWTTLVGIQDPVRSGVPEAIKKCERAGVRVIMVTGDNVETARAIAKECGILKEHGTVLDGPSFRRFPEAELESKVQDLCVLARSSPEDKKVLVNTLQRLGEIVAVTGDGTNDAPALRTADVGFSMGITGTEVAKESSDIILMDDNFASIVKALAWGRAINDAVKKFLQFQITVNITAVVLTFASAIPIGWFERGPEPWNGLLSSDTSVINAVQLLWVNLIMDSFAALALATDPPNDGLFDRKPEPRGLPLINHTMWKMIWCQFFFQTGVAVILYFTGPSLPMIKDWSETLQNTLIFNIFVWSQIVNLFNCRRIDNSMSIFHSFFKNRWFLVILFIMIGGQVLIIFVGGSAFVVQRLPWEGWVITLIVSSFSIPVAAFARKAIPDKWFTFPSWLSWLSWAKLEGSRKKKPSNQASSLESQNHGQGYSIDDLSKAIRGKLRKDLKRGRKTNIMTQGLSIPFLKRSQGGSFVNAVVLPGAIASSMATPSDGRSIRSQSLDPEHAPSQEPKSQV